MQLTKFVKSNTGKYMMSIILGIGIATFFRSICKGKNCIIYKAPPLEEIENKVYKFDNKCYKFEKTNKTCDSNKRVLEFA